MTTIEAAAIFVTIFCPVVVLYLACKPKLTRRRYADNPTMDAAIAGLFGDTRQPLHKTAEDFYKQIAEHCAANAAHFDAISYRYRAFEAKAYREGGIVHSHPRRAFGRAERQPEIRRAADDYAALHAANAAQVSANASALIFD